jgi:hypothetical protein
LIVKTLECRIGKLACCQAGCWIIQAVAGYQLQHGIGVCLLNFMSLALGHFSIKPFIYLPGEMIAIKTPLPG